MFQSFWSSVLFYGALSISVSALPDHSPKHTSQPSFSFDKLWSLQTELWDNFLYPANVKQVQSINSTVFSTDIQGRVDITRNFVGRELNTEYLFGLFSDPTTFSFAGVPISYSITQFAANGNIASATTVLTFNSTTFGLTFPVTIDTWTSWNAAGQITQYDATFRWFEWLLDTIFASVGPKINTTSTDEILTYLTSAIATSVCSTHTTHCTGSNQQYANATACYNFLTQDIRFGESYELGRNTLLCRQIHSLMIKYRPSVHCPHIGPTGGDMCVDDQTYAQKVLQKGFFTNAPWIPYGYKDEEAVDVWQ